MGQAVAGSVVPVAVTRRAIVDRAVKAWTDQLVDLSGRNGLLYYRDLGAGTLDLAGADPATVEILLAGVKVRLSALFRDPVVLKDAARRCRKIREKARENLEERGIETLYLASMLATWTPETGSAAVPAAPVLLRHLALTPTGAAGEDFELDVEGAGEPNPTLFYALQSAFGVRVDLAALQARALNPEAEDDDAWDLAALSDALREAAAPVPGFALRDRLVMGNFSYTKLPMVVDLQTNAAALASHELVAAIAGDAAAQAAIRTRQTRVDPAALDQIPLPVEHLVLDADSSQQAAIETVSAGSDVVIQGPPGTGKSQTIANLIAACTARGLRVLFVAEKRAAIDAVIGRLGRVGLGDLVLDLHGGAASKRRIAENLAAALASARSAQLPHHGQLQAQLAARRGLLGAHARAVHEIRDPWGVSLYEAQGRAIAAAADLTGVRLPAAVIDALGQPQLQAAQEDLRALLGQGVAAMSPAANPWSVAGPVSAAQVEALGDAAMTLSRESVPALVHLASQVLGAAASPYPLTLAQVGQAVMALAARARLDASADPGIFEIAPRLAPLVEPARRGLLARIGAQLFNAPYRAAMAEVRGLVRAGSPALPAAKPSAEAVAGLVAEAATARAAWSAVTGAPLPLVSGTAELAAAWSRAGGLVAALAAAVTPPPQDATDIEGLAAWAAALDRDLPTLGKLPEIQGRRAEIAAVGFGPLVDAIVARGDDAERAVRTMDGAWATAVVERVLARDQVIGGMDAARLCAEADVYANLDRQHIGGTSARVKREWAERAVAARDGHPEQDLLLSTEAKKKSRHLPIRDLFAKAPDVLTAVKPCWAMSPLLVSQILPGDRPYFDIVVFDEASQILPADAIPSIARGRRAVVAGDELQLPPTTFFASQSTADLADEDAETLEGEGEALLVGFDSILSIADPLIGSTSLRWHYRSRDERLIAFSNLQIYGPKHRELVTFPAVSDDQAIRHVRVAPRLEGATGVSSAEEVAEVVRLVLEQAATRPGQSLGVIAMGINHAERISEALRLERPKHPELDAFFSEAGPEPFFVKNLERVQGDERDTIILTVGYGRNADGRLRQNFGPVNQQGGERRLNVAITRSKRRMIVVSSFGSEDIDAARTTAEGVKLLRAYLRYAESGGTDLGSITSPRPELNGFERDVAAALAAAGIGAVPQLGTSGYYLDFALTHPSHPGRFVLAVECDGASYHSAPNTRERDRLRQQQLEAIGWRFHRIWSTDWFRDRAAESARLVAAYQAAVAFSDQQAAAGKPAGPAGTPAGVSAAPTAVTAPAPERAPAPIPAPPTAPPLPPPLPPAAPAASARGPRPRVYRYASVDVMPPGQLDAVVMWIQSDGQLRTEEEIIAEAMTVLGFKRRGAKIVAALEASVARVRRSRGR